MTEDEPFDREEIISAETDEAVAGRNRRHCEWHKVKHGNKVKPNKYNNTSYDEDIPKAKDKSSYALGNPWRQCYPNGTINPESDISSTQQKSYGKSYPCQYMAKQVTAKEPNRDGLSSREEQKLIHDIGNLRQKSRHRTSGSRQKQQDNNPVPSRALSETGSDQSQTEYVTDDVAKRKGEPTLSHVGAMLSKAKQKVMCKAEKGNRGGRHKKNPSGFSSTSKPLQSKHTSSAMRHDIDFTATPRRDRSDCSLLPYEAVDLVRRTRRDSSDISINNGDQDIGERLTQYREQRHNYVEGGRISDHRGNIVDRNHAPGEALLDGKVREHSPPSPQSLDDNVSKPETIRGRRSILKDVRNRRTVRRPMATKTCSKLELEERDSAARKVRFTCPLTQANWNGRCDSAEFTGEYCSSKDSDTSEHDSASTDAVLCTPGTKHHETGVYYNTKPQKNTGHCLDLSPASSSRYGSDGVVGSCSQWPASYPDRSSNIAGSNMLVSGRPCIRDIDELYPSDNHTHRIVGVSRSTDTETSEPTSDVDRGLTLYKYGSVIGGRNMRHCGRSKQGQGHYAVAPSVSGSLSFETSQRQQTAVEKIERALRHGITLPGNTDALASFQRGSVYHTRKYYPSGRVDVIDRRALDERVRCPPRLHPLPPQVRYRNRYDHSSANNSSMGGTGHGHFYNAENMGGGYRDFRRVHTSPLFDYLHPEFCHGSVSSRYGGEYSGYGRIFPLYGDVGPEEFACRGYHGNNTPGVYTSRQSTHLDAQPLADSGTHVKWNHAYGYSSGQQSQSRGVPFQLECKMPIIHYPVTPLPAEQRPGYVVLENQEVIYHRDIWRTNNSLPLPPCSSAGSSAVMGDNAYKTKVRRSF